MEHADLARSFLNAGADYERYRPGFPAEALEPFLSSPVPDVLDLGAGTGKLTRLLLAHADHVTAVDPSEAMLAELRRLLPEVAAMVGTAEDIPLPDASQDLVTVAQAFHWFDEERACAEISRVLRAGGVLALLWNVRSPQCRWDVACDSIAHPDHGDLPDDHSSPPTLGVLPGFAPVTSTRVEWSEDISRADYLRRWSTVSTLMTAGDDRRRELLQRMERVLDTDPETSGRSQLPLRQATDVLVYRRQG